MSKVLKVTKFDAAHNQLYVACKLFFANEDPVSIHTLASASLEILGVLSKRKNLGESTFKKLLDMSKKLKFPRGTMTKEQNFFKHADKDPEETLNFKVDLALIFLYESINLYRKLYPEMPIIFEAVQTWAILRHPEICPDSDYHSLLKEFSRQYSDDNRAFFLEEFELAHKLKKAV